MEKELLAYSKIRYPLSEDSEANLTFANKITETDNMKSVNNDLIYRSGVKFEYKTSEDYKPEIMRFLNYVLELPNQEEEKTNEGEEESVLSLADCFTRDV